jgi:glucan phosphoethanolaminetransferase (alkaline phosphatase superfamily)
LSFFPNFIGQFKIEMTFIELGTFESQFSVTNDTLGMKISLWVYLALTIIIFFCQIILISNRSDLQPLKARGTHILYLLIIGQLSLILITNVRIASGRFNFSCLLYTFIQYISGHSIFNFKIK